MSSNTVIVISALTGLIGTAGGLVISYLTLRHAYRKDRHILKFTLNEAIMVTPIPGTTKPEISENMLTFRVANVGLKDFMVVSLGLQLGRRSGGLYINQPAGTVSLPYKLPPDGSCDFWTEYAKLIKDIKKPRFHSKLKIKAYVSDYLGNKFYSNSHTIEFQKTRFDVLVAKLIRGTQNALKVMWP